MKSTVNERVRLLRSTLNLSQSEFSAKLGMSSAGIWKLETGDTKPRQSTLITIAKTFNVSQDWLIDGVGELVVNEKESQMEKPQNWKDKAFEAIEKRAEHLEEEVLFLRETLKSITSKLSAANFNDAFGLVGLLNQKAVESVRAAA